MRHQRGFTLLELVVATAIVVIIGIAAGVKFNQAVTNRDRVGERSQALAGLQRAFIFMQRDFEQAVARPARDEQGDIQPALASGQGGQVELTHAGWSNPFETRQRSSLQRVRYRLADGVLYRDYWDHPDRQVGSTPVSSRLVDEVESFAVQYLHEPEKGNFQWRDDWPLPADAGRPAQFQAAPLAVSIEITVAPFGTLKRFFRITPNPHARGT